MEEENKKARRVVRKEYNDTIRELVAFMRKRVRMLATRVSVIPELGFWRPELGLGTSDPGCRVPG